MTDITLWLDSYNDIYSDFDSRHYQKRRISEDFLHELRSELKTGDYHNSQIILLLPYSQRDESSEKIISTSLTGFFTRQFLFHQNKCRHILRKGAGLFIAGVLIMLFNSWINYRSTESFLIACLKVIMEPAGWFLVWTSFDFLFYDLGALKKERDFFRQLCEMDVHFRAS